MKTPFHPDAVSPNKAATANCSVRPSDAPVRSYERESRAKIELRRRDDFAGVGRLQMFEEQNCEQRAGADRRIAPGRSKPDGDRGQGQRAADRADLVAGLADREDKG